VIAPATAAPSRQRSRPRRLPLVLFALAGGFAVAVEIVSSDWAAFRMSDDFATSAGFAGLAYVAYTAGMTTGRFGGDWAQHRLGTAGLMRVATAVAAIGLAGASLLPWRYAVLAAYVLAGIGVSTFFPRLYDEAARVPGKRGAGLGSLTAGSRITGLAVPTIVGSLAATSLSVGTATALVTLPCIVGFALVGWLRHRPGSGLVIGPARRTD
jgi:fucose permease